MTGRELDALIQRHDNVGSQRQLHLHGPLRREEVGGTVQMRTEVEAVLSHVPEPLQAHDLESTAVRQDDVRPAHEAVQSTELANSLVNGPQIQMVSVGKQEVDAQLFQLLLRHSLNRARRAHGHEGRGFDNPVRGVKEAGAGPGEWIPRYDLKSQIPDTSGQSR